ncbi:hypothetical protein NGA_0682600 [Nannochloropsis gaditana CCMP526]|nr:hypothetical protein NGA_0682600 [Nannochloropsis gaditana CCMP526]EKU23158.1 hypothetical protein NGA_0682600 [Nannochloropsis gaditana CCMP526]|eukprot:XP_005852674.1 hypothetical protein NGA_0682600 [Nannochloropsis gaditana CCMP526]
MDDIQSGLRFLPCSGKLLCFPIFNLVKARRVWNGGGKFHL